MKKTKQGQPLTMIGRAKLRKVRRREAAQKKRRDRGRHVLSFDEFLGVLLGFDMGKPGGDFSRRVLAEQGRHLARFVPGQYGALS